MCVGLSLMLASVVSTWAQTTVSKEYQIKAAYLYNFAKFVEWPASAFTNSESPLVIGVCEPNLFGDELMAIARDHSINGRKIVVKPVANAADLAGVHLLFIGASHDAEVEKTLAPLKHTAILTVGESDKFEAAGGDVTFVNEENRVRFEINAPAAARQGLKISAQILKLARNIRKDN